MSKNVLSEVAQGIEKRVETLVLRHESTSDRAERAAIRREIREARSDFRAEIDRVPPYARNPHLFVTANRINASLETAQLLLNE